ncbi:MAG: DUF2254 domain-containing protein [Pseudomonadota bacterium]
MNQLHQYWDNLRSSLWFIPTIIVTAGITLALVLIEIDSSANGWQLAERWPRLFGASAEGSRGLLSAIASSMITVAGTIFSITVVALTLASSQYTSRILRNFMRDRANQSVLGVFVGVFAYCLILLRTIRSGGENEFVPALAVLVAVLLAFVAIGFLIFFIHHIAASLQATSIIESVATETLRTIDQLFPVQPYKVKDNNVGASQEMTLKPTIWVTIPALKMGYIQAINFDTLFDIAKKRNIVIRMEKEIGAFIIEDCALASISGVSVTDEIIRQINATCAVDRHRSVDQDASYGIRQIVDVALKALSPGINDTTTAINCIDYLGSILVKLVSRRIESPCYHQDDQLRVISCEPTFSSFVAISIDQIRQNADGNVAVLTRLLQILMILVTRTSDENRLSVLNQHINLINETVNRSVPSAHDRLAIQMAQSRHT